MSKKEGDFFSQIDRERKKGIDDADEPYLPKDELSEEIFSANLQYIREIFEKADEDGNGSLDVEEFVSAFKDFLGRERDEDQLVRLFNRIDSNANNFVDWVEFYSYLFLEKEGRRRMAEDFRSKEFIYIKRKDMNHRTHHHADMIQRVLHSPKHEFLITATNSSVKIWKEHTFMLEETIYEAKFPITDVHIHGNDLFISDMGRTIVRYDLESLKIVRVYRGKQKNFSFQIPRTPSRSFQPGMKMRDSRSGFQSKKFGSNFKKKVCHSPNNGRRESILSNSLSDVPKSKQFVLETLQEDPMVVRVYSIPQSKKLLVLGTDDGLIKLYDLHTIEDQLEMMKQKKRIMSSTSGLLPRGLTSTYYGTGTGHDESDDSPSPSVRPFGVLDRKHQFGGWISGIEFLDYYRSIFVSSWDGSIKMFRLDSKVQLIRAFQSYSKKPIYSISYDPDLNLLSSCGRDEVIELYNPSIKVPIVRLSSHRTPVLQVCFNPKDNMVISLGQNKTIKVWDTRTFKVIQTIREKKRMTPENQYTSLFFHPAKKLVLTASSKLHGYQMRKNLSKFKINKYKGTQFPVRSVLYSNCMEIVVTCDRSTIYSWNVRTGKLVFRFFLPSGDISFLGWDDTQRRIIIVQMNQKLILCMNYLNGQLLKKFETTTAKKEISAMCYTVNKKFEIRNLVIGGCERKINVFNDNEDEVRERVVKKFPSYRSDILSIICVKKDTLICGLLNGSIVASDLKTGKLLKEVNPQVGPKIAKRSEKGNDENLGVKERKLLRNKTSFRIDNNNSGVQIEKLLFMDKHEKLFISVRGNGIISFWTVNHLRKIFEFHYQEIQAQTKSQMEAVDENDAPKRRRNRKRSKMDFEECCSVMVLSPCNRYLVTGDLRGFIDVFDISSVLEKKNIDTLYTPTKKRRARGEKSKSNQNEGLVEVMKISRFRAHQKEINSLDFVKVKEEDGSERCFVVSGSMDCTASLFTLEGTRIGYFGQSKRWNLDDPTSFSSSTYYDLRKFKNIYEMIDNEDSSDESDSSDDE